MESNDNKSTLEELVQVQSVLLVRIGRMLQRLLIEPDPKTRAMAWMEEDDIKSIVDEYHSLHGVVSKELNRPPDGANLFEGLLDRMSKGPAAEERR